MKLDGFQIVSETANSLYSISVLPNISVFFYKDSKQLSVKGSQPDSGKENCNLLIHQDVITVTTLDQHSIPIHIRDIQKAVKLVNPDGSDMGAAIWMKSQIPLRGMTGIYMYTTVKQDLSSLYKTLRIA